VLIESRSPLGITDDAQQLGARRNLLQSVLRGAGQNVRRLLGGGY
jgi:hypothetical protein